MAENEKLEQTAPGCFRQGRQGQEGQEVRQKVQARRFSPASASWFKDMKSELKKVQWPTGKQTINNTLIVIACVVVVGIFIWLFDAVAGA